MIQKNVLDFGGKLGIFSTMLGGLPTLPAIIAALGNLKREAVQGDRVLLALLCDELKLRSWPREKMRDALFFKNSNLSLRQRKKTKRGTESHCHLGEMN